MDQTATWIGVAMAALSVLSALGSAFITAASSRRAAADKLAFDAELVKLKTENERYKMEFEACEKRSDKLEAEIVELRTRLAVAESKLAEIQKVV